MHWSAEFVGLPWADKGRGRDAVDCWGLVMLAFARRDIALPSYTEAYASAGEKAEVAALLGKASDWPWRKVEAEREMDIAIFRRAGADSHIGVVIEPGRMLHCTRQNGVCIESYRSGYWAPKLSGFYRHVDMAGTE